MDFRMVFLLLIWVPLSWGLLSTLAFPRNYRCMTYVRKRMSYREFKRDIESDYFREPIVLCSSRGKKPWVRLLISRRWVVIAGNMRNPTCIPRQRITEIELFSLRGPLPTDDKHGIAIWLDELAADGRRKMVPVKHIDGPDYPQAKAFLEREFRGAAKVQEAQ